MHERGKSDRPVVPANLPNKAGALGRVREMARRDKGARFTALLHHITVPGLRAAYWGISPKAAPGVDVVT
jgi:hypothetical protein